ncbi:MAG: hypothetical protein HY585_03890 [Candidatus Omnitrophica bacterium]|nr:hypothetical protein [Candidatus Omnitrophota bacterium]
MKKLIAILTMCLLVSSPAYAYTYNIPQGMGHKIIRGAVNLFTGVVEIPMQTYKGYHKGLKFIKNVPTSKAVGTILGLFRGFGHAAGRVIWGGTELFGFWAANPATNEGVGIPFDAPYAWQMGEQYDIFKPTLAQGLMPIPRKLGHGLANSFAAILEVPGQTIQGSRDGNAIKGLGKGFWFWWSRVVYGFSGIAGCLTPNSLDNPGYPLNGDWPWSALVGEAEAPIEV